MREFQEEGLASQKLDRPSLFPFFLVAVFPQWLFCFILLHECLSFCQVLFLAELLLSTVFLIE